MEDYLEGSWLDFEAWIRREIGSDFRWKVRPMDSPSKRRLVAELIMDTQRRNKGVFPGKDAFIERVDDPGGAAEEKENGH